MNYGKRATSRRREALISRSSMLGKRAHVSLIRILFLSLIAILVVGVCVGVGSVRGVIDNAPDVDDIDIMPLGYASFLYDVNGNQLRKLAAPSSNRLPVSIDKDYCCPVIEFLSVLMAAVRECVHKQIIIKRIKRADEDDVQILQLSVTGPGR